MKNLSKAGLAMWILAMAPLIVLAVMYGRLPDRVPLQWGFGGDIRYGGKAELWMVAGLSPAMAVMFTLLPKIDPRRRNYKRFRGHYDAFCIAMMLFMLGMTAFLILEAMAPGSISVMRVVPAACGLLFAFLGNMMPKVKSNFFMGVRTPWALSDMAVWNKTHRLAGFLFFFGGIIIMILSVFAGEIVLFTALMVIAAAASVVPYVMSYVWYRRLNPADNADHDQGAE